MDGQGTFVRVSLSYRSRLDETLKTPYQAARLRLLLPAGIALSFALSIMAAGHTAAGGITTVGLGVAAPFAVLAGTPAITNVGLTEITGDVGIHPASSVTGFPPGIVNGEIHAGDDVALAAKNALITAYNDAALRSSTATVAGGLLGGGAPLVAGVYNSGGFTLDLTGTLTLDAENNPDAVWIFQATSDLITAPASTVEFVNGGSPCNVFWQVTSSAALAGPTFVGTILALASITMTDDVTVEGRALARNGNVTLINDTIDNSMCVTGGPTPTPAPTPVPPGAPGGPTPTASPLLPNTSSDEDDQGTGSPPVVFFAVAAVLAGTALMLRRGPARTRRTGSGPR